MAALPLIATVASAAVTAAGTIAGGNQARAAGNWQAAEYERQAGAERAAAQRDAHQIARRTDLAQSRLQTVAAASGFSATDPTALNLTGEIEGYGTLQEQMAMYGGADRAAGLGAQATLARYSGEAAQTGSRYRAVGTVLGSVGEGLSRYRNSSGTGQTSSSPYHFG